VTAAEIANRYRERAAWHISQADRARTRSDRIGYLRLSTFLALVLAIGWLVTAPVRLTLLAAITALAALVAFIALLLAHRRARRTLVYHENARAYHELGERRIERDWAALPLAPVPPGLDVPPSHPYAADLDITGRASLFQLLDVVSPAPGRPALLATLLEPAPTETEIRDRQSAVAELTHLENIREELGVFARLAAGAHPRSLDRFLQWSESQPKLLDSPPLVWIARLITAATIVTLLLSGLGILSSWVWLASATIGLAITRSIKDRLTDAMQIAEIRSDVLRHYGDMLAIVERQQGQARRLVEIRERVTAQGAASAHLASLRRIMAWAEVRYSPMLHAALQWLFMWDVHIVARLEEWQRLAGTRTRVWMASLGEFEVLAAFATLWHDNPDWTLPEISDSGKKEEAREPTIEAVALGHPLLPEATRVANDVTVGPPGTVLLITGSNMSGKSTLLRAIGVNVVLAQAGAPVCAERFLTPLIAVHTSIRIQDSLEQGISLFMAELKRLKAIVEAARVPGRDRTLLYLLDEILHGTNTAERRIAARMVIGHLIEAGAIGAVTTHDLSLAAEEPMASAAQLVHFTEHFDRSPSSDRPTMSFDYRLRPGLATSANALALVELIGLGKSEHDSLDP
jgi:hypothetical protein